MVYHELYASSDCGNLTGRLSEPEWFVGQAVDRFKILRMSIPMSFHSVNSSNNTILFSDKEDDSAIKKAVLPPSDYNITNIEEELGAAMNRSGNQNYTVSYDIDRKQITVTAPQPFRILSIADGSSASWLGIARSLMPGLATSVTFPNLADFSIGTSILLVSRSLPAKNATWLGNQAIKVIGHIDCSAPGSVLDWENNGSWLQSNGDMISTLDISLLDSKTLFRIQLTQPFTMTMGILTDVDDPEP
ncbi:hypothetical protein DFS34DRAFT_593282 [Phlyctochytrium arcticum]|nr:hypothetical protein DFS34DRAFT_593282 [Phlyctochytrium arcticum]